MYKGVINQTNQVNLNDLQDSILACIRLRELLHTRNRSKTYVIPHGS